MPAEHPRPTDEPPACRRPDCAVGQPDPDHPVEVVRGESGEPVGDGVRARHLAAGETEGMAEAMAAEAAELADGGDGCLTGQSRHQAQSEQGNERVLASLWVTRVGPFG